MKLYAAFDEYGNIWPTTIRRTEEAAMCALREEPQAYARDPLCGGVCIGAFDFGVDLIIGGPSFGTCLDKPFPPKLADITWVRGWRTKGL